MPNEGSSDLKYEPQVDDYVVWTTELGQVHEGWVFFKTDPPVAKRGWKTPLEYITIEIGMKKKPECQYEKNNPHKYIHVLLCCYKPQWNELRYVKHRVSKYDNTCVEDNIYPDYKSQDGKYEKQRR